MPVSPVYQLTVLVDVPGTSVVAVLKGDVPTRSGGSSKKSLPAWTADAATSEVFASFWTDDVRAALRLAAVAVEFKPIANDPAGVGTVNVAVSCTCSEVPSGKARRASSRD